MMAEVFLVNSNPRPHSALRMCLLFSRFCHVPEVATRQKRREEMEHVLHKNILCVSKHLNMLSFIMISKYILVHFSR